MAQTGFTPIQLYSTSTAAAAPSASNLTNSTLGSELAINITDGKLFYKDNANAVQVIGWKTVPTTAGGTGLTTYTAGDLSYYASGTTFTKLAIGTAGQILSSTGTAPQWTTLSGVAVTTFSAGTTGFTPNSATSGAVTLAGTLTVGNGGTGTATAFTAGSVVFAGASGVYSQKNANLFWDNTNNRLGINNVSPGAAIDIAGNGNLYVRTGGLIASDTYANYGSALSIDAGGSLPIYLKVNTITALTVHTSTGVSIGNTTDPGAGTLAVNNNLFVGVTSYLGSATNATFLTGGIFSTVNNATSCATATPTTIFSIPNNVAWIVSVYVFGGGIVSQYTATSLVHGNNTGSGRTTALATGANISISISTLAVQVTQTSGSTLTVNWSAIRIA